MSRNVVVVGAGISGLATAWNLRRALPDERCSITVLERAPRPGGTAWTERLDGYALELGPNGFLDNKPTTLDLCESVGLKDRLVRAHRASANRFVFLGDRLRKLPASPGEFLKSDLLSWRGKLRVLAEPVIPRRRGDADESIDDFGRRRIGREATDNLLDAFVTGILAGDPKLLSLPACFPRMVELEREFGSLIRAQVQLAKRRRAERKIVAHATADSGGSVGGPGGNLTAPEGGVRTLIEAIATRLGSAVRLGVGVTSVETCRLGRWRVVLEDAEPLTADAVVLACPAYSQSSILRGRDGVMADEIAAIPYSGVVVAVLGFHRSQVEADLNGFGYLAPERLGRPVLGVRWSSSLFDGQAPADHVQFRAILGGWRRGDVSSWDDETVVGHVREDLRVTMGISTPPRFSWVQRWERAIPQYHMGHCDRLARIETRLEGHPGLFLTGNCYRGVSLNDCTREANATADRIVRYLRQTSLNP